MTENGAKMADDNWHPDPMLKIGDKLKGIRA